MECGSFPGLAFDCYIAVMGHNNAMYHGQAQASPFTNSSCRIERLEDPVKPAALYAMPGILNAQSYISPCVQVWMVPGELFVNSNRIQADCNRARFIIKRLVGIATQVHD